MSFSKLPKGACGGLMGLGWLSIFGGTSHELVRVEPDRQSRSTWFVRLLVLNCMA